MCGIVRRPAKRDDFRRRAIAGEYQNIPTSIVLSVAEICEEAHLSQGSAKLVLSLADHVTAEPITCLPFAVYADGKRYTSPTSLSGEEDAIRLAMAESIREMINAELAPLGIKVVMGHCCDIQKHSLLRATECMSVSNDRNMFRADKLRHLTDKDCVQVDDAKYLELLRTHEPQATALFERFMLKVAV